MRNSRRSGLQPGPLRVETVWHGMVLLLPCLLAPNLRAAPSVLEDLRYSAGETRTQKLRARNSVLWTIPAVSRPPVIDGQLEDACWRKKGARLGSFSIGLSSVPARHYRRAWAVYDEEAIYVGLKLQREPGKELRVFTRQPDDAQIWEDDELEVFIDPFGTGTDYYQLILNSEGVLYDASYRLRMVLDPGGATPLDMKEERQTDLTWNSGARRRISVSEDSWTLEIALPLHPIGLDGAPAGHTVRFNLTSADWDTGEYTCLAPVSSWHDPQQFGSLVLGKPRVQVSALVLDSVGKGRNQLVLHLRSMRGQEGEYRCRLRFSAGDRGVYASKLVLLDSSPKKEKTVRIPFEVEPAAGPWHAEIKITDGEGNAVYAARRTGDLPPPLNLRLASRGSFNDGLPVEVAASLGMGRLSLKKIKLRAFLFNARGQCVKEQNLGAPRSSGMQAKLPIEGLSPGRYRLRLTALQGKKEVASAEDSLRIAASPFAKDSP